MRLTVVEPSPSGGLFQFVFQLADHLAAQGHIVELLTGRDPELTSARDGFSVLATLPTWHPGAASAEPLVLRKARRLVRAARYVRALAVVHRHLAAQRPDAVLWAAPRFPLDSWAILTAHRRLPGTVHAVLLHEPQPLRPQRRSGPVYQQGRLVRRSFAAALRAMDVIFVLGRHAREQVLSSWSPPGRVEVIEHGDEGVFLPAEVRPRPADATEPVVLFFGNWNRWKGLDVLLDAFPLLRARVPGVGLVVAGAVGNSVDYEQIARAAGRTPGVELRPGYVPLDQVASLFSEARVVVVPYLRGNQSGVVHLAQTFARPVVATTVGDIPAAVPDGEAGLLVPPRDPEALASALHRLLVNPAEARRLGEGGRRRLAAHGSWTQVSADVAAALERAALERAAPGRTPTGEAAVGTPAQRGAWSTRHPTRRRARPNRRAEKRRRARE